MDGKGDDEYCWDDPECGGDNDEECSDCEGEAGGEDGGAEER